MTMRTVEAFPRLAELVKQMRWEAREVVREVNGRPHLLERVTLLGPVFEERALEPYVSIGSVAAQAVEIGEHGTEVRAYFDETPPDGGVVEFGYLGDGAHFRFPQRYSVRQVPRLDPRRLPQDIRPLRRRDEGPPIG